MIRGVSGRMVLLVLAIGFVVAMIAVRHDVPKPEDPVADAQQDLLDYFGFSVERQPTDAAGGLKVTEVKPGGAAQALGLTTKDVLLAVNESSVWHAKQVFDMLSDAAGKGPVRLMLRTNGVYHTIVLGRPNMASAGGRSGPGMSRRGAGAGAARRGLAGRGRAGQPGRAPRGR